MSPTPQPTEFSAYDVCKFVTMSVGWPFVDNGRDGAAGVDCYGLVLEFCRHVGRNLPDFQYPGPTSCPQYRELILGNRPLGVRTDTPLPGDIVLVALYGAELDHMGVYVPGHRILHATAAHGVIVSSLASLPYSEKKLEFYRLK